MLFLLSLCNISSILSCSIPRIPAFFKHKMLTCIKPRLNYPFEDLIVINLHTHLTVYVHRDLIEIQFELEVIPNSSSDGISHNRN